MSKTFKDLDSWRQAILLASKIYKKTKTFPKDEIYGMTSQIRRASVSVSSKIAEGSGLGTKGNYIKHLNIAIGSLNEVDSLNTICCQLGYFNDEDHEDLDNDISRVRRLLYGLRNYIRKKRT